MHRPAPVTASPSQPPPAFARARGQGRAGLGMSSSDTVKYGASLATLARMPECHRPVDLETWAGDAFAGCRLSAAVFRAHPSKDPLKGTNRTPTRGFDTVMHTYRELDASPTRGPLAPRPFAVPSFAVTTATSTVMIPCLVKLARVAQAVCHDLLHPPPVQHRLCVGRHHPKLQTHPGTKNARHWRHASQVTWCTVTGRRSIENRFAPSLRKSRTLFTVDSMRSRAVVKQL